MKKELNIEPVKGRLLPIETDPRAHITKPMPVPNTAYYRRAVKRGDVKLTGAESAKNSEEKTKKGKK